MDVKLLRLARLYRIRRSLLDAFHLMRNPLVPLHLKLIALGLALLILSPLNVLGYLPIIGLLDDVALLSLLAGWFVGAANRHENMRTLDGADLVVVRR